MIIGVNRPSSSLNTDCRVLICNGISKHILLEVALLLRSIWEHHSAEAVLDASYPLALIHASIGPKHLPVSLPLILKVVSFVDVAAGPGEHTFTVLSVVTIVAFVNITCLNVL